MAVPKPVMEKEIKAEERGLTEEINALNKKVSVHWTSTDEHRRPSTLQIKYLDKQFNDAQGQLKDIVSSIILLLVFIEY